MKVVVLLVLLQAHLVAAFEQSLGNMTIRLKSLTLTAEQKVRTGGGGTRQQRVDLCPLRRTPS